MRIYIESTIPSYLVARPAKDLLQAARQKLAQDWWERESKSHELFTSQVVLDEIAVGDPRVAALRMRLLEQVPLLEMPEAALELAQKILYSGALPAKADRDATHIALATFHGMEVLLTWNCRHIANASIHIQLRRLLATHGWEMPLLATPEEMLGMDA